MSFPTPLRIWIFLADLSLCSVGFYGEGDVPTYCHAGGNGPNDFVCQETSATTIVIDGQ